MSDHVVLRVRNYVKSDRLTIEEVCTVLGTPRPTIEKLLEEEIVRPASDETRGPIFRSDQLEEIERVLRLHEDLGVNWAGVAIIHDLLDRLESLHRELERKAIGRGGAVETEYDV